jgi:NAD(P)-dependent dehydrogenase (short-subunit alcohol dehydrogenase family)
VNNLFSLSKKRALVTGASRGIGHALALGLAKFGAEVFCVARGIKGLQELQKEAQQNSLKIEIEALDITDLEKTKQFIKEQEPFSILVNNAGTNRPQPVVETSEENYDFMMNVNTKAAFFLAKEVAKKLLAAKKGGSIINISSQMGHISAPNRAAYSASNHAIEGFTKAMAWEWGKNAIRVNTVCPTFVETSLTKPMMQDKNFLDSIIKNIALGRIGQPEEIIGPVVFLASDAASLVTGSALMVDGGWTAR